MAKLEEDIECENCEAAFTISYNDDLVPLNCPFCGAELPTDFEDDD